MRKSPGQNERFLEARKTPKKEKLMEERFSDPMIAAHVLLAPSCLGAAGASDAAKVNPVLADGDRIEGIINLVRAKLRVIVK